MKSQSLIDKGIVERLFQHNLYNRRPYASFFEWENPDDRNLGKQVKERSVACELIRALERDENKTLFRTVEYGEDPPDIVAIDTEGRPVGFEVTELVDAQAIIACCLKAGRYKRWAEGELIAKLLGILKKKSRKLGKCFTTRNILVIYTDEPELRGEFCKYKAELSRIRFEKFPFVDEAFLLFSYVPGRDTYPYIRLNFQ
jgi:hypothetical protein